jgi:hypothetical protein
MALEKVTAAEFSLRFANRARQLAWFVGAGASAAAGIPTGQDMIADFKTRRYCADLELPRREVDPGDPLWLNRITSYFDGAHGLPQNGHPDEYAAAFELAYPEASDRRIYIDSAVRRGTPSFGHRVLAAVIASRQAPVLFTTNFDPLIEDATVVADSLLPTTDQVHLAVADLARTDVAERCLRESDWPLLVKLHGDFKSDRLKNIESELEEQDEHLRRVLIESCHRFGLVVVGYSGRDESVMNALLEATESSGAYPSGLFWCARPGQPLLPAVTGMLDRAAASGVACHVVEAENFDELAGALERQVDIPSALVAHVRAAQPASRVRPAAIPTQVAGRFPVLRTSAMPLLSVPAVARRIVLSKPATSPQIREQLKASGVRRTVIEARGTEVAAFGCDHDLIAGLAPFGPRLDGEVSLDPLADSWARGLLYDALARAVTRRRPLRPMLRRRGHVLVVAPPADDRQDESAEADRQALRQLRAAYKGNLSGVVADVDGQYAEGVGLRLEHWLDGWWCILDPLTWIEHRHLGSTGQHDGAPVDNRQWTEAAADWRRERWAQRYNSQWHDILGAWAHLLAPQRDSVIRATGVKDGEGVEAEFVLHQVTAWCPPGRMTASVGNVG